MSLKNKKIIFFYFLIQIIPSSIIILSLSIIFFLKNYLLILLIFMSLLIKLRIPPFHFWLILISSFIDWFSLFTLLTIQKIIPFYLISLIPPFILNKFLFNLIILSCAIIPTFNIFNLTNLKNIISFSSINQSGWILILLELKNSIWFIYLIFYSLISYFIIYFIYFLNFSLINSINNNLNLNIYILFIFFNLASIPPFSFFFFKWYNIFLSIINSNIFIILIIIIIRSFIILFTYIYISLYFLYFWIKKIKFINLIKSFKLNLLISILLFINLYSSIILLFF